MRRSIRTDEPGAVRPSNVSMGEVDGMRWDAVLAAHVEAGRVGGVAWLVARDGEVTTGTAGTRTRGRDQPVRRDSVFRIASMTKPIVAVAALILVEECRLRLDDPVDELLPELAGRRVLVDPRGPLDGDAVPADRAITVRDVLTSRLGLGMDFTAPWPQPLLEELARLELGWGPPEPQLPPPPDEWMRRLATLPLLHQPGARWLYNTSSDVLGVLVARAAGQPLDRFLRERVFDPLGMSDTGFHHRDPDRLGSCHSIDPTTGEPAVEDPPDGQWSTPPAFPSGAGGLVSTVDDYAAFAGMLLRGGRAADGSRLLSAAAVEVMTTDHLVDDQHRSGPASDGSLGWGFGLGVQLRRTGLGPGPGGYGWSGGLGSSWWNDPAERLIGVVLTTDRFDDASPSRAVVRDFETCLYADLDR